MTNYPMLDLLSGLFVTLILVVSAVGIGLLLTLLLLFLYYTDKSYITKPIDMFVFFVRGTPLLVQLFIIYYGFSQFLWIRESWVWWILREPMACTIMALSINTACYTFVLLRGALHAVPKNELLACQALGMSKWLALRRILLPRAFQTMLPAYSNEVIIMLKCTSLASTVTLMDLMGYTQQLIATTYQPTLWYVVVGSIYLLLNGAIMMTFNYLYQRKQFIYS